jgi:hypothetical protein
MKSKLLLALAVFATASFALAAETPPAQPADKPAAEKKDAASKDCDDCCDKPKTDAKADEAKPATAEAKKK